MAPEITARIVSNWSSAAGALQGILAARGNDLPRQAVMGVTGHAWHLCLQTKSGVLALPGGPHDLDWAAMVERYARTGTTFERFGARIGVDGPTEFLREDAVAWASERLTRGIPVAAFDFHLHEWGILYAVEPEKRGFLVDSVITGEVGPFAAWADWPSNVGMIELFAPVDDIEPDPDEVLYESLATALACFRGEDGAADDGQPRGTAALDAWATAMDGTAEIDRAGNAYTLAVLQAARLDGADFLATLIESIPPLAEALAPAERAIRDATLAIAPLITLFPFPTGGHGNVNSPGLREAAANALRRAAGHERRAAEELQKALDLF